MDAAVRVQNLGKSFPLHPPDRIGTVQEMIQRGLGRWCPAERFWGLRHISFTVPFGRTIGILGRNGAGKSTLLRLLGGVGTYEEGSIEVQGRISGLLELGPGFHPDLTGRENVMVSGVIGGLKRREVTERLESIVQFAELEQFIDHPLRTYSNGMRLRLAFAVAVHTDPDILLVDEVLTVGDFAFQQKCLERMDYFKSRGCTILIASHDVAMLRGYCDEVLRLAKGRLVGYGPPAEIIDQYTVPLDDETLRRTREDRPVRQTAGGVELRANRNRYGSFDVEISEVRLRCVQRRPGEALRVGDPLVIEIDFESAEPCPCPIFGITLHDGQGHICLDTSTDAVGMALPAVHGTGTIALTIDRLDLNGGLYHLSVWAYRHDWAYAYDYHLQAYPLRIKIDGATAGTLCPPHRWELQSPSAAGSSLLDDRAVEEERVG